MLDTRRTPIRGAALRPEPRCRLCEVSAFEDRGAVWTLPIESVSSFQFDRGAGRADAGRIAAFRDQIQQFNVPLIVERDRARETDTLARLQQRRSQSTAWFAERRVLD